MEELEKAIQTLRETLEYAEKAPPIMHKLPWALYQTWKIFDKRERDNNTKEQDMMEHQQKKEQGSLHSFQQIQDIPEWLFIGAFPGGDVYADKRKLENGDYKKIALVNKYGILWSADGIKTDASVRELIFKSAEAKKQEYIDKINQYDALPAAVQKKYILGREYETLLEQLPASMVINQAGNMEGMSLKDRILNTYETLCKLHGEQNDRYLAQKQQEKASRQNPKKKSKTR